MMWTIDLRA